MNINSFLIYRLSIVDLNKSIYQCHYIHLAILILKITLQIEPSRIDSLYETEYHEPPFDNISHGKFIYLPKKYIYLSQKTNNFHDEEYDKVRPDILRNDLKQNYNDWKSYVMKKLPKKHRYYPNYSPYKNHREYMYNVKGGYSSVKNYNTNTAAMKSKPPPIRRLFDKPLIASPEAAMSSECIECDERGKSCMLVRQL